ncbi:hypothetical protein B0H65DRAFT_420244 [Neurospora tetraspora]|uniref:Uncharacterized protein n=1 Tax=Neurospora tetraspora TaxID=94610 RepID=A0AAE0JL33_9PEZI|nr:hypothetical protein B0H65DRAFT_420244 [Neurospora tetraspora]
MGVKPVSFVTNMTMSSYSTLPSLQEQATMMDTTVLHAAYGMAWLEQAAPPFTTGDYALMPFSPENTTSHYRPNENLTAVTDMYTVEVDCWQAAMSKLAPRNSYMLDNGHGCAVNVSLFQTNPFQNDTSLILYVGYYESAILDYYLEGPHCSTNSTNQFLTFYAYRSKDEQGMNYETNITASFCEASFYKQPVTATVSAESGRPLNDSVVAAGPKERLSENEFNSTAFGYITSVGMPPITPTRDYPAATTFEPWGSLSGENIAGPTMPMVNLALGLSDDPAIEFQHAAVMERAFTTAYKTIFSAAISQLTSKARDPQQMTGKTTYALYGVVVSRTISAIVEGLLVLLVFLMGGTLYTSVRTKSKLVSDPATIGFALRSVKTSRAVRNRLAMEDCSDAATLQRSLVAERFFLEQGITGNSLEMESKSHETSTFEGRRRSIEYTPVRPKELSPLTGCLLVCLLLSGAGVLIYFKKKEQSLGGLPRPSENFEVLQLLENYIPTILTTLLEPFLVLLTRLFCILQPFNALRNGKCNPERTLEAKYTSLPPQLVLWRAIRSRHFLLTILCVMALLVNVLTVALGGTFNELPVKIQYPTTFSQVRAPELSRDTILNTTYMYNRVYQDHYYAASTNFSHNTTLPPWVTTKYTFLPVEEKETVQQAGSSNLFRSTLRGFGAEAKCEPLSTSLSDPKAYANVSELLNGFHTDGSPGSTFNFLRENGTWQSCYPMELIWGANATGLSAREVVSPLSIEYGNIGNKAYEDHFCEDRFVVGWLRVNSEDPNNTFRSTFLQCQAVLKTAMFDVDFDKAGHILAYTRNGDFDDITQFMSLNMSQTLVRQANRLTNDSSRPFNYFGWHNVSMVVDWWNYLLKSYLQSSDLVDPTLDVPKPEYAAPAVEELYQRLFAILLGQNFDMFKEASEKTDVPGVVIVTETRIFLDDTAFMLSVVILCLNAAVLVWFYAAQSEAYLPRLPSTLGSLLAYTAASRAVTEYGNGNDSDKESGHRKALPGTFSFGRYLGVDGNVHVGIEMDPFVTPIDGTMLRRRSTARSWFQKKVGKSPSQVSFI